MQTILNISLLISTIFVAFGVGYLISNSKEPKRMPRPNRIPYKSKIKR